jgi:hypothetical protein
MYHGVLAVWIVWALISNPGWAIKRTHVFLFFRYRKSKLKCIHLMAHPGLLETNGYGV